MIRNTSFRAIAAVFVLALASLAQTLPQGVTRITSVEGITEYALPNGFHVLLFPDASMPKITVNMTYMVGSRFEGYGETGMAHLLEHLMFKETKTRKDIKQELKDHGAEMNGSTSWDRTNYFETMTATDENLKFGLELEADRMVNAKIEKPILDTEMTVVRNEFEMRENSPEGIMMQRALEHAYTWHNYGKLPIGNRSDIENVPIHRLAAFYQKYYQPDNAMLTIAGKFDPDKTLAQVARLFGAIPKPSRVLEQTYTVEPTQDGERTVTLRRVGDTQGLAAVYHGSSGSHPDDAALNVLAGVLGDNPSGRLYKALVDNKKAVSASMGMEDLHDPGFLLAMVRLRTDQSLDEARQILIKTIEGVVNEPPTKEEVERQKTRLLKNIDLEMTDSQSVALDLSEYYSQGDWRLMFLTRDRIKAVTPEDVLRVAKNYLKESNRTLASFVPTKNPDRAEIPATPDVEAELKSYKGGATISEGEAFNPTPANIEARVVRSTLPGGLKMSLLSKKTRGGTVMASVTIRYGDEKSLFGKSATAGITGGMLMRGTKHKSRQQIQDEMDALKAHINVSGGPTNATASIETVEANLPGALKLAAEILREPSFPENEFETVRQQRIAAAEAGRSEPQSLAFTEYQHRVNPYPRGDARYVPTADEQIEDLKKVTLDDVKKFYQQFYGASVGEISVSGQFNAAEIGKLANELFGNWKSASGYTRLTNMYHKVQPEDKKIETPDKQNAFYIAGETVKMTDEDPDYAAMELANYMFGGSGLGTRLSRRIRDKEGLSYGVFSQFIAPAKDDGANYLMLAISAPQNTPKVDAALRDELAKALKDGFAADEVAAAKKAWVQEQLINRSQDGALVGLLSARARFDRTLKFDESLEAKVNALTAEQVSAVFRKYVDLSQLIFVKAGDFRKAGVLQ
ncbi:MAG TPA: pitrilysin family protein [Candidatus Acidoferrales bacterium]|nr:pitrilysin family protein [Candidatus Acidoferrales bacterium]